MTQRDSETTDLQTLISRECPDCRLNWWLFPPVHIHGLPMVRCIECKRVYDEGSDAHAE